MEELKINLSSWVNFNTKTYEIGDKEFSIYTKKGLSDYFSAGFLGKSTWRYNDIRLSFGLCQL